MKKLIIVIAILILLISCGEEVGDNRISVNYSRSRSNGSLRGLATGTAMGGALGGAMGSLMGGLL